MQVLWGLGGMAVLLALALLLSTNRRAAPPTVRNRMDPVVDRLSSSHAAAGTGSSAADGLRLALNIGAMLIAFVSLIALLNLTIGQVGGFFGYGDLTFEQILGYVSRP